MPKYIGALAGAVLAMMVTSAASAVPIDADPYLGGQIIVDSAQSRVCPRFGPVEDCTVGPFTIPNLPNKSFSIPALDGDFSFHEEAGPSINAGVFTIDITLRFVSGNLLDSNYAFRFRQVQLGETTVTENTATGSVPGVRLRVLGTDQILAPVPEPATWAMLLFGFAAMGVALRRLRRGGTSPDRARPRRATNAPATLRP